MKYPGIVTVSIGKPIDTAGLSPEEVNARVESWIEAEMRRIDPLAYAAPGAEPHRAGAAGAGR
jgi:1-acyl-sn-glycerol-3-phosphate acyltransferase